LYEAVYGRVNDWLHNRSSTIVNVEEKTPIRPSILEKLESIEKLLANQKRLESIQAGSDFYESEKFPLGYVLIRKETGDVMGCGCITKINGKHVLLTAGHVVTGHENIIISTQERHLALPNPEIFMKSRLDVVGIRLPTDVGSKLGVKCAKLARTPSEGTGFQIYGYFRGKFAQTTGVILKGLKSMFFTHSASTVNGWSGSPIYGPNGKVVGIHSRSLATGANCAVSLDFLLANMETEYKDNFLNRLAEMAELEDEDDWMLEMDGLSYIGKAGKKAWRIMRDDREFRGGNLGDYRWSDELDEFDNDFGRNVDDHGLESAMQVFQERPTEDGAQTTITGLTVTASQTTSGESEDSKSTPSEGSPKSIAPKKKKSRKSKNSADGSGPTGETKLPSKVSDSTPENSSEASGSQPPNKNNKSLDGSWMRVYTQELLDQTGRGVSPEMSAIAARLHANAVTGKTHTLTL